MTLQFRVAKLKMAVREKWGIQKQPNKTRSIQNK